MPSEGSEMGHRKWQPTPIFLPGEFHGQRILVGYSPRGRRETDMTERLRSSFKEINQEHKEKSRYLLSSKCSTWIDSFHPQDSCSLLPPVSPHLSGSLLPLPTLRFPGKHLPAPHWVEFFYRHTLTRGCSRIESYACVC